MPSASQIADHLQQIPDLTLRRRFAAFEVLRYAETVEERQHNIGDHTRVQFWLFRLDVFYQQSREFLLSARNNFLRFGRQTRKLAHRIHGEASSLIVIAAEAQSQKPLNVAPTERLRCQDFRSTSLGVALKASKKEVLLIFELRIQARLVDAGRLFQVLNCRVREALFPKDRDGPVQHTLAIELFRSSHASSAIKELIYSYR